MCIRDSINAEYMGLINMKKSHYIQPYNKPAERSLSQFDRIADEMFSGFGMPRLGMGMGGGFGNDDFGFFGNKGFGSMVGHMESMMQDMHRGFEQSFKRTQDMMRDAERSGAQGHYYKQTYVSKTIPGGDGRPEVERYTTSMARAIGGGNMQWNDNNCTKTLPQGLRKQDTKEH
eukprot:TRINITY_DN277_c0_g2_i2.p2 TRINITY_DN277_c0_g2~~TRINITY_DN277_c0_g2_i2.p2  ORF type:complete len:174 (+),score=25.38 TRINITY_DN277_c0_g2_i2:177-698(+)